MSNATFSSVQLLSHIWIVATPWKGVARLPCLPPTARPCSNSCPSSQWCHPTISSSVIPFFSCLQSFQASGSFTMSQFLASDGQSIGVSALASVLPMNIQDWFPLGWTDWISLQFKGLARVFSSTTSKASILQRSAFFIIQHSHPYLTTEKTIALTRWTFVGKVMSLLFNMLSSLVITFLPRSKHLLISFNFKYQHISPVIKINYKIYSRLTQFLTDVSNPCLKNPLKMPLRI